MINNSIKLAPMNELVMNRILPAPLSYDYIYVHASYPITVFYKSKHFIKRRTLLFKYSLYRETNDMSGAKETYRRRGETTMQIGKKVYEQRLDCKMTMKDLAARTRISVGAISKIDNGNTIRNVITIKNLANAVGPSVAYSFM